MHIKFLEHGKGSAAFASAYLLDELDHKGQVRAGIEVLRGDATTFNAICNASPHLWKYTSGVIAWSKRDDPTDEQIQEVLNNFEKHAFAGLEQSQYHLFAVLHTDDDGSKHIHVLTPRLDIQSGKSLNIAPPGHERHFDALRDYFNTKYQWSRPDDPLLRNFTQEPNHIAKLNKQAEKIIAQHDLEKLKKSQFRRFINEHIHRLLGIEIENRADIVRALKQLNGVQSIRAGKNYLTVTLNNNDKHRLKGAFYDDNFELGAYAERLRKADANKPTDRELAAALREADQLRETYRAKRAAYNEQYHPFKRDRGYDKIHRIESKLDFDRGGESITRSAARSNKGLSRSVKSNPRADIEYRYIETPTAFSLHRIAADRNQQSNWQHFDRSEEHPSPSPGPSEAGDRREPKRANRDWNSVAIKLSKSQTHDMGEYSFWGADDFNQFLYDLSVQYKPKNHPSTKRNDSTEFTNNSEPTQLPKQFTEISYADRDRPIFDRAKRLVESTKQIVSRTKRLVESTNRFITDYLKLIQRARTKLKQQNPQLGNRERNDEKINFSDEIGAFKTRTRQIFGGISAKIIKQLEQSTSEAMDASLDESGFNRKFQEFCASRNDSIPKRYKQPENRDQERSLENIADACSERLQRRIADDKQASRFAREKSDDLQRVNLELEQLEMSITNIRLRPKPATDFSRLRYDGYYPDYVISHRELSGQQEYAYQNKRTFDVIHIIKKKSEKLMDYISQARKMLNSSDYQLIKEIIKNDERMLRYLKCDDLLEPQNCRFKDEKASYLSCIQNLKEIRSTIDAVTSPQPKSPEREVVERSNEPELTLTPEQNNDFNFDF